MKLVVGLGNPGKKFQKTRHNTGHQFISKFKIQISKLKIKNQVKLRKTTVFMNDSGEEVKKLAISNQLSAISDLLVVHDDMDIALGDFKLQFGRSAAGHKGVQSVIDALGTQEFWRLRFGIGNPPPGVSGDDFVLEEFSREEFGLLRKAFAEASPRILEWAAFDRGGVGG